MNWQKIKFKCSKCKEISWFEIDLETYVISEKELICDNCNQD